MINTGLDNVVKARPAAADVDFSIPVPEGDYLVEVEKIDDWVAKNGDVMVNLRNDRGFTLKDEKGKPKKELVKDCTWYNANMKFKIVEGEHTGRFLFSNLTTHPNAQFITETFLDATGKGDLTPREIQANCVGSTLMVEVKHETYEGKETDSNTGIEKTVTKTKAKVTKFKPAPVKEDVTVDDEDLPPFLRG